MWAEAAEKDGRDVIGMTVARLSKWAFKIPGKIVDRRSVERTSWIVSEPFGCMQYINDGRYLQGEINTDMVKILHPRQNSLPFLQTLSPRNRLDLKLSGIIVTKDLKNVDTGGELHASYSCEYKFPNDMFSTKS